MSETSVIQKTDAEWRAELTPEQFRVLREHGTERPGASPLNAEKRQGRFMCAACETELFGSETKYESGSGWPSFYAPVEGAVATTEDRTLGMKRVEVHCARCGGHLGHVFPDGPKPTGLRYCMNGAALKFEAGGLIRAMDATAHAGTLEELRALLHGESDAIANAANLAALIFARLPRINWAGFYFLQGETLVLGPFQGLPACTRIPLGRGVCGTAALQGETLVVDDVHSFDGHIACDSASASEIVIPFTSPSLSGVLDIDSPEPARFGAAERALLEGAVAVFVEACGTT